MKTVMKTLWHGKQVIVKTNTHYIANGFNKAFRMKIQVEETYLLPEDFIKGAVHTANIDIIDTVGGLPHYVIKILDNAAKRQYLRRTTPVEQQLSLF